MDDDDDDDDDDDALLYALPYPLSLLLLCLLTVIYAAVEWLMWAHEREHAENLATGKR